MAEFLRENGVRAVAVHAGESSAPRTHSLEKLEAGELDVVCSVDMFNEGVDLPHVDTVLMLRPTESRILWLQQFGRGLRYLPGKTLRVIDYIGNHRIFLTKTQALCGLGSTDREVAFALDRLQAGTLELPPGCSVTYELQAIEILRSLLRATSAGERL
jgi:superfamily II DNA or RNA helicase